LAQAASSKPFGYWKSYRQRHHRQCDRKHR
jgi:hypothetical protein